MSIGSLERFTAKPPVHGVVPSIPPTQGIKGIEVNVGVPGTAVVGVPDSPVLSPPVRGVKGRLEAMIVSTSWSYQLEYQDYTNQQTHTQYLSIRCKIIRS